jgi:hypothetical protein
VWRARRTAAGGGKAAVGQGATRGICREQEVALIGSQRWRAAAKSGSGRRPGSVARRGKASAAREGRWCWAEAARGFFFSVMTPLNFEHLDSFSSSASLFSV